MSQRETAITLNVDGTDSPKIKLNPAIVLREDGRNFLTWKTIVPALMQAESYAWEVVSDTLKPSENAEEQKKYEIGNRNSRTVFFNIIHPNLILTLFYDNSETATGTLIWEKVKKHFANKTGTYQEQAYDAWFNYKFSESRTVHENILAYRKIVYNLTESGVTVPSSSTYSRLLSSLPQEWRAFKQAWNASPDSGKSLTTLIEAIQNEAVRMRNEDETVEDVTVLMARTNLRRRRRRQQPQHHFQRRQSNTRRTQSYSRTTEVKCWTCGGSGHTARFCRRRAPQKPRNKPEAHVTRVFLTENSERAKGCSDSGSVQFVIDSGSSHHVLNNESFFTKLETPSSSREVRLGNNGTLTAQGSGTAILTVQQGTKAVKIELRDALLVPDMNTNLISVSKLTEIGYKIAIKPERILISTGQGRATAECDKGLYILNISRESEPKSLQTTANDPEAKVSLKAAHSALAHLNKRKTKETLDREGIAYIDDFQNCDACQQGKQHRNSYRTKPQYSRATRPGFIHGDLCSPGQPSLKGFKHFLCLTDDYSKFRKVFFLKMKSEAAQAI